MSEFSLTLVLQFQTSKIIYDMAKIIIKSEKLEEIVTVARTVLQDFSVIDYSKVA